VVEQTFETVQRVAEAYTEQLLAVDPGLLDGAGCERVLRLVARVERVEAVVKARLVKRATAANRWQATGHRSPGDWLAGSTGTTVGQARAALGRAEDLAAAPATEAALAAGAVSPEQAAEVAAAARVDPTAERGLLAVAQRESLTELRRRARKVRAAATDDTARREQIRRERHLRSWTDAEGAFCFAGRGLPEDGKARRRSQALPGRRLPHRPPRRRPRASGGLRLRRVHGAAHQPPQHPKRHRHRHQR
jgi:hypothetical protein